MELYSCEMQRLLENDNIFADKKLYGRTVLITGASGMIGTCLTDLLMLHNHLYNSNIRVTAVSRNIENAKTRFAKYWDNPLFQYISCDVNEQIPECGQADYIIHAASNTHPLQYSCDPVGTITANVIGTKNLLDYAARQKTDRFCFLSSFEIYGENRGDTEKFTEDYLGYINCNTLRAGYPESKRLGEALCNAYQQENGVDFCIPRLSRVYGPTMMTSDSKAVAQFIKKAQAREDIVVKSDGRQISSYTFVTDAAMGVLYALLRGKSTEAYNVADEESEVTLRQLAEYLAELAGTKVKFENPDEKERRGYSSGVKSLLHAKKLCGLGWSSRIHWRDGLAGMMERSQVS